MQCKAIRANKMTFQEFKQALQHIAVLIGVDKESVVDAIIASQGPLANNITLPMYVKCHDDRERWTGAVLHRKPVSVALCACVKSYLRMGHFKVCAPRRHAATIVHGQR